jgi:hypothetical protein
LFQILRLKVGLRSFAIILSMANYKIG